MTEPTYKEAIYLARLLIEPGENPEYERGMCELIGDLWATPEVELAVRAEEVHRDMLAVDISRPWNAQGRDDEAELEYVVMRCADETGWPERKFYEHHERDFTCTHCGWMQSSFEAGCAELVFAATWHNTELLAAYVAEAQKCGYPLKGEIHLDLSEA